MPEIVLLPTLEDALGSSVGKDGRYHVRIFYDDPILVYGEKPRRRKALKPLIRKAPARAIAALRQKFETATGTEICSVTIEVPDVVTDYAALPSVPAPVLLPALLTDLHKIDAAGGVINICVYPRDVAKTITGRRFSETDRWQARLRMAGLNSGDLISGQLGTDLLRRAEVEFGAAANRIWPGFSSYQIHVDPPSAHERLAARARLRQVAAPF